MSPQNAMPKKLPVALIIYKRPDLTQKVLERIVQYEPSALYVIADGAKAGASALDVELIQQTRALFAGSKKFFKFPVHRLYSEVNLGLRNRVLSGMDRVFQLEESCIILEDDCVPEADFFSFCELGVGRYRADENVFLVGGTNFGPDPKNSSVAFSHEAYIWGWCTWKDRWTKFRETSPATFPPDDLSIEVIKSSFVHPWVRFTFMRMLRQIEKLDSWAIELSCYLRTRGLLSLVPPSSLVTNIGYGAASTHTNFEAFEFQVPVGTLPSVLELPMDPKFDEWHEIREGRTRLGKWIKFPILHPISFMKRILSYLRNR